MSTPHPYGVLAFHIETRKQKNVPANTLQPEVTKTDHSEFLFHTFSYSMDIERSFTLSEKLTHYSVNHYLTMCKSNDTPLQLDYSQLTIPLMWSIKKK